MTRDRSGEKDEHAPSHASEEQIRLILESATDFAIFTLDPQGRVTTWNVGAQRLLQFRESEILGQSGRIIFTPEDREARAPEMEIETALSEGRAQDERWHLRKDGSRFWGSGLMLPLRASGTPGLLKIMRDDTARHRADQLNQLLIDELKHRVKNTLALVQSIVRETLRGRVDKKLNDAIDERLIALARSHDILTQDSWEGTTIGQLLRQILKPFLAGGALGDRIVLDGPSVFVPPQLALALGLAFHELATNAAKYGALSIAEGMISIDWTSGEAVGLRLHWRERNGPRVTPPDQRGFGSRLIEKALPYGTSGTTHLEFAPEGLQFDLVIPETALTRHIP